MQTFAQERAPPEPVTWPAARVIEQVRDEAMFLVDRSGRIASWNEGVQLILGWDAQGWIGQPLQVAFTPDDVRHGVPEAEMRQALNTGRADDTRWMRRRSGEHFFALGSMTRLLDDDGRLVGYLKVLRDFTGQKLAQEERERLLASESDARALAQSHSAALHAAVNAIADGVCIGDAQGLQRSNSSAMKLLGAPTPAALQRPWPALVQAFGLRESRDGPTIDPAGLPALQALTGEAATADLWARRADADGSDVLLRWTAAPIVVEGRVAGAVTVLADLGERMRLHHADRELDRVENVLQARNAELRALLEGVRDYAIFTIDPQGLISSWHRGAELMKGYTAEEAIGMPFARLFTPEDQARGRPACEMEVAARDGEYKGDGERLRKDGTRFEAQVVLTALRGTRGELLGFIKLTQDVTERKRLEREREATLRDVQAARATAERASQAKSEFLATISHELRTPLSAILGWAHVLEKGVFEAETVKHGLAAISRNAHAQVQLIEDLLDMNRIESGQLRLDLQRIELGGVVAAAIDAALPVATAKGIALRTVFDAAGASVMGDAPRLQQVVGNLLGNAVKFTPAGGEVSVSVKQADGRAEITVADTGQGIGADFIDRLFDRFQQQDATTTRRHGGLGIGLAIVRHLVELHGGGVTVHSAGEGQGATFTVNLPAVGEALAPPAGFGSGGSSTRVPGVLADRTTGAEARRPQDTPAAGLAGAAPSPRPVAPSPPAPAVVRRPLEGVTVLVVDDEPDVRAVASRFLTDAGASVLAAASAAEALTLLETGHPAAIVSDIGMAVTDGYDLIRQVRALPAERGGRTPAAAFTAYTAPEDAQRALAAGYQMHVAKPVLPDALVAAVARLVQVGSVLP